MVKRVVRRSGGRATGRLAIALVLFLAACGHRRSVSILDMYARDEIQQSGQRSSIRGWVLSDCPLDPRPMPDVDVYLLDHVTGELVTSTKTNHDGFFLLRSGFLPDPTRALTIRSGNQSFALPGAADGNYEAWIRYPCVPSVPPECAGYAEGLAAHEGTPLERGFLLRTLRRCPAFAPAEARLAELESKTPSVAAAPTPVITTTVAAPPPTAMATIIELLSTQADAIDLEVWFAFDSAEVSPASRPQIEQMGRALTHPGLARRDFIVVGHADAVGSPAYNLDLSRRRAESVCHILVVEYSVDRSRLKCIGYGSSAPTGSNVTAEGRALNRRVSLRLDSRTPPHGPAHPG